MKKIIAILSLAALMPLSGNAQTSVIFATNFGTDGHFVTDTGGANLTRDFFGQLWAGPTGGTLSAIGSATRFTTFQDVENPSAAGVIVLNTPVQVTSSGNSFTADIRLYAWDAAHATFSAAQTAGAQHGQSAVMTGAVGGANATGPATPAPTLIDLGFQSFQLVPEPGTVTLGLLGLGGLIAARRKRRA